MKKLISILVVFTMSISSVVEATNLSLSNYEHQFEKDFSTNDIAEKDVIVVMKTSLGDIELKLYKETPLHSENFINLVKAGKYDGLLFHRVIKDFMIQAGDPESKNARLGKRLGDGDVGYTIPAEFNKNIIHKRGALAAARDDNPKKESSGIQFYIVQGKKFTNAELDKYEMKRLRGKIKNEFNNQIDINKDKIEILKREKNKVKINELRRELLRKSTNIIKEKYGYTQKQREIYMTLGGTPHLDGNYSVFGEVLKGIDIVGIIAGVNTDKYDRPKKNVIIVSCLIKFY